MTVCRLFKLTPEVLRVVPVDLTSASEARITTVSLHRRTGGRYHGSDKLQLQLEIKNKGEFCREKQRSRFNRKLVKNSAARMFLIATSRGGGARRFKK